MNDERLDAMDDLIFYLMMMVLAAMALCIAHGLRDTVRALRVAHYPASDLGLAAVSRRQRLPPASR